MNPVTLAAITVVFCFGWKLYDRHVPLKAEPKAVIECVAVILYSLWLLFKVGALG